MATRSEDSFADVDTLRFRLTSSKVIARTEVLIAVTVIALVGSQDADKQGLDTRVGLALQRFVAAEWTIRSIKRERDDSGFERVTLFACARVKERENYNLTGRARSASEEGLSIQDPNVDYSLGGKVLNESTMLLQTHIVEQAKARIAAFNASSGREWRIGDIQFGERETWGHDHTAKGARRENSEQAAEGADLMITSERLFLVAQVTLKSRAG